MYIEEYINRKQRLKEKETHKNIETQNKFLINTMYKTNPL